MCLELVSCILLNITADDLKQLTPDFLFSTDLSLNPTYLFKQYVCGLLKPLLLVGAAPF